MEKESGNTGTAPPKAKSRHWLRKTLWVVPTGCLTLIVVIVGINWLTLRALQPPRPAEVRDLSFQGSFGSREARGPAPIPVEIRPPGASHLLPEVLSVTDALEREGRWIILDRRMGKIHFLDPAKGLIRSLGRKGKGPGEFESPVALALKDSTLWVLNQGGLSLDRLSMEGELVTRRRLEGGGCLVGLGKALVTLERGDPFLLRFCPATVPGPGTAWVEQVSEEGKLTALVSLPLGDPGSRKIHFLREPVLTGRGTSLFLGTLDTPCLQDLSGSDGNPEVLCLPPYNRPAIPEEKREEVQGMFRGIAKLGLLPLGVSAEMPWYDRVFAVPGGLVFRRFRSMEERELVLVGENGTNRIIEQPFPEKVFVGERTILVAEDRIQGTEITVFLSPWG